MIDGLIYGSMCGLLLIVAGVIGAVLNELFGQPRQPTQSGSNSVIGERLSERSIEYWHREQIGNYDRQK